MTRWRGVLAAGILASAALSGCATSPADREETIRTWQERDAERARECEQRRGRWVAGGCVSGGGA